MEEITKKTVINVFKSYYPALNALKMVQKELKEIHIMACSLNAINYDAMPKGTGAKSNVEMAIEQIEELTALLEKRIKRNSDKIKQAEELISYVSDETAEQIIRLRWFQNIKFNCIPAKLFISERTMFYKYNSAIKEIIAKLKSLQ